MARAREMLNSDDLDVNSELGVEPSVIQNELLAYFTYYMNKSAIDSIVNATLMFYAPDEIRKSKDLLWKYYGSKLLGKYEKRRGSSKQSVEKSDLKDIQEALKIIDENYDEDKQHICAAINNMDRLPRVKPEEAEMGSILSRMRDMELEFRRMDAVVTQNAVNVEANTRAIKEQHDHVEAMGLAAFETTSTLAQNAGYVNAVKRNTLNPNQGNAGAASGAASGAVSGASNGGGDRKNQTTGQTDTRRNTIASGEGSNRGHDGSSSQRTDNSDGSDGFQYSREERRKMRRKAVFGKKQGQSETLKTGIKPRELFVFGFDAETTAEEITGYILEEDPTVRLIGDIERKSREGADTTSFLLKVSWPDSKKLLEPEFWPEGAGIRPFFRKRERRTSHGDSSEPS